MQASPSDQGHEPPQTGQNHVCVSPGKSPAFPRHIPHPTGYILVPLCVMWRPPLAVCMCPAVLLRQHLPAAAGAGCACGASAPQSEPRRILEQPERLSAVPVWWPRASGCRDRCQGSGWFSRIRLSALSALGLWHHELHKN